MKITHIIGREIFDSRGFPALECEIILDDHLSVYSSVASGASRSSYEAHELRDGGKRLMGFGLTQAIGNIERVIAPLFVGKEPNAVQADLEMVEIDGTDDKSKLGANTILAVSKAMYKAQTQVYGMDLFQLIAHLCSFKSILLPRPFFNIINGGIHAQNNLAIQEFMIVPLGAHDFRSAFESSVTVFYELKKLLYQYNKITSVGDEGGFAPFFTSQTEPLDFIMKAIEQVSTQLGISHDYFALALDVASTQFFNNQTGTYVIENKNYTSEELISWYEELINSYPICSIEDGLSENDWAGWQLMTKSLGSRIQLVGDDIFATNKNRIIQGMESGIANTVLIKLNQVGTVTEAIQALRLCQENQYNVMVSHRSGETEDTFIADFAVGACAGQIKAGGCSRSERVAKYNRLLRIEDLLTSSLLNSE